MAIPYLTTATLPYGTRVLTINTLGFIANNFSTTNSLNIIERTDALGAPNGAVGIRTAATGSAQLQAATTTYLTTFTVGDAFSADAITYFLTEVSKPEEAQGFKILDISFRESA
jgi:hypothetical protein